MRVHVSHGGRGIAVVVMGFLLLAIGACSGPVRTDNSVVVREVSVSARRETESNKTSAEETPHASGFHLSTPPWTIHSHPERMRDQGCNRPCLFKKAD